MIFPANLLVSTKETKLNITEGTIHQQHKDTTYKKTKARLDRLLQRPAQKLEKSLFLQLLGQTQSATTCMRDGYQHFYDTAPCLNLQL